MAVRDQNPSRLWRIADFPSLRLVINIEFFRREKRRHAKAAEAPALRTCSRWCSQRSGALSCVGGFKGASMLVGLWWCARKSYEHPADHCPLFATRRPSSSRVPTFRRDVPPRGIGNLPGNTTNTTTLKPSATLASDTL